MPTTSLFPDEPDPLVTPGDRAEPTVWVRRIVVVASHAPDAVVIREVEFKTGLNIIRVADRPAGETRPIGHSVGKTLLARLIRYCLGEAHFADADTAAAVRVKLPTAYAVAEIRVAAASWVVARPLRVGSPGDSWAVRTDDWRAALAEAADRLRYTEFVDTVTAAVLAPLPEFRLPYAGHAPRWVDLLAWLARDYECHYQHHNEWRDPEAGSGTARLHRDDAGLLTSWAMELLDTAEIKEQAARAALRADKTKAEQTVAKLDRRIEVLRPMLGEALGLDADTLAAGVFGAAAEDVVNTRRTNLNELLKDFEDDATATSLRDANVQADAAVSVAEQELERLEGVQNATRAELRQLEDASQPPPLDPFDPRAGCPLETECPFHSSRVTPISDPARAARIGAKRRELAAVGEQIAERTRALPDLSSRAADAKAQYKADQRARQEGSRGTLTAIARVDVLGERLTEFTVAQSHRDTEQQTVEKLDGDIEASLKKQRAAKGAHARRHRQVNRCFDHAVRALLGPEAGGQVVLDARGMRPEPNGSVAVRGAAIRSLGTVLAFDLGCLAAAVEGVGRLPAFWLHDSPRDADIEAVLYDRLFRFVRELELAFGEREPAFQYIVTTTTPPPPDLGRTPFVRLTLDARDEAGLLLGVRL